MDWKQISWDIESIEEQVDSHAWECIMYGYDEEGNYYTGLAVVVDAHTSPEWFKVTDVEKE